MARYTRSRRATPRTRRAPARAPARPAYGRRAAPRRVSRSSSRSAPQTIRLVVETHTPSSVQRPDLGSAFQKAVAPKATKSKF